MYTIITTEADSKTWGGAETVRGAQAMADALVEQTPELAESIEIIQMKSICWWDQKSNQWIFQPDVYDEVVAREGE